MSRPAQQGGRATQQQYPRHHDVVNLNDSLHTERNNFRVTAPGENPAGLLAAMEQPFVYHGMTDIRQPQFTAAYPSSLAMMPRHDSTSLPANSSPQYNNGGEGARRSSGGTHKTKRHHAAAASNVTPLQPTENLFLCYLPPSFDDYRLYQLVAQHGIVVSAKVMMDLNTKCSRGFGFSLMASVDDAARARQALDGLAIEGKRLQVRFAAPPANDSLASAVSAPLRTADPEEVSEAIAPVAIVQPVRAASTIMSEDVGGTPSGQMVNTNLYVKGIPLSWRENELGRFFARYGTVLSAIVLMEGRDSKGIGLVRLEEPAAVEQVLKDAPLRVTGWPQPITVRFSRQSNTGGAPTSRNKSTEPKSVPNNSNNTEMPASGSQHANQCEQKTLSPQDTNMYNTKHCESEMIESSRPEGGDVATVIQLDAAAATHSADVQSNGSAVPPVSSPTNQSLSMAPNKIIPGPFGLLLRMNNPYARQGGSNTSTPAGELHTNPSASVTATEARSSPIQSNPRYRPLRTLATSSPPLGGGLSSPGGCSFVTTQPPTHSCQYCQLGTTLKMINAPTDQSQLERWVDRLLSGFGAVIAKEVYHSGTALITFVDSGAAHVALQTLMASEYQPELYDCSQGLYIG